MDAVQELVEIEAIKRLKARYQRAVDTKDWELMRGVLDKQRHDDEVDRLRSKLAADTAPHLQEFLAAWNAA